MIVNLINPWLRTVYFDKITNTENERLTNVAHTNNKSLPYKSNTDRPFEEKKIHNLQIGI